MINNLCGQGQGGEILEEAVGRTIASVRLEEDADTLEIRFEDGSGISVRDEGQSCCEIRYMRTDDDLGEHAGARLLGMELRDGPTEEDKYGEPHEVQFLEVRTSAGHFVVSNHNEHNGYYGGFWLRISRLGKEESS